MDLITTGEQTKFADDIVKKRGFIRGKHITWHGARNGLITFASPTLLQVLFLTGINASASYFTIRANEVANNEWDILYSNDLETVHSLTKTSDLVTEVRKLFTEEDTVHGGQ